MVINIVVAATENNVIGGDNKLLWHLPRDMAFFKNVTWGMPVIMGRKTYDSLGRPLKGRTNIVITRDPQKMPSHDDATDDIAVVTSLDDALTVAAKTDAKECFVIGGGEIFKQALAITSRIYMTRVLTDMQGDTYFPSWDSTGWTLRTSEENSPDEKHAYPFRFEIWDKNPS